jgi:hypothetical protein
VIPAAPVLLALTGVGYYAGALDPPAATPQLLDSGQFAYLGVLGALVVFLLAVIAVGIFRR